MITKETVKQVRQLHQKKFRTAEQLFIIEGIKMLEEALRFNPECIQAIYVSEKLELPFVVPNEKLIVVTDKVLRQLSTLKNPQGIVAVCRQFSAKIDPKTFSIALDRIQDPGNMGTILRLAAWFGVKQIIASPDSVDQFNPKVVQASMGAIFNVSVVYTDLKEFLSQCDVPVYGALLSGENVYTQKLKPEGIILMGNEGNGISDVLLPFITSPLHIPKFGVGESLNVAMATGVFLSEFYRGEFD